MKYIIKIEKEEVIDTVIPKEWKRLRDKSDDEDKVYGYTPEVTTKQRITNTIYTQEVDKLNLASVIAAINQMNFEL